MRVLSTLSLIIVMMSGCPSQTDTDTDTDSDTVTETDTDSCPGAIGQEEYIQTVLPVACQWGSTCPDFPHETVEDCVRALSTFYNGQPCWDECRAAECAEWMSDPPFCNDSRADILPACNEVKTCPD